MRFEDESFDLVLCNGVLKMVPNKLALLGEIWRVIRPGKCAFISDMRRDGMEEFEKTANEFPEEERERIRAAIGRSLTKKQIGIILEKANLSERSEINTYEYRIIIKITKD